VLCERVGDVAVQQVAALAATVRAANSPLYHLLCR